MALTRRKTLSFRSTISYKSSGSAMARRIVFGVRSVSNASSFSYSKMASAEKKTNNPSSRFADTVDASAALPCFSAHEHHQSFRRSFIPSHSGDSRFL